MLWFKAGKKRINQNTRDDEREKEGDQDGEGNGEEKSGKHVTDLLLLSFKFGQLMSNKKIK